MPGAPCHLAPTWPLQAEQLPHVTATRGNWAHLSLVDLRPEQRALHKNYMYAEEAKSMFLRFPTKKTFDHRKL